MSQTTSRKARHYAEQLRRGERVRDKATHHRGMRLLLAEALLDPRSPHTYIGVHSRGERWGGRNEYVLSTAVADYAWESRDANRDRGLPTLDDDVMRELRSREEVAA